MRDFMKSTLMVVVVVMVGLAVYLAAMCRWG